MIIFILFFAVIGILAAGGMLYLNGSVRRRRRSRLLTGVEAPATIVETKDPNAAARTGAGQTYYILLEVHPAGGPPFTTWTSATVSVEGGAGFEPGGLVRVKYDPGDPTNLILLQEAWRAP